MIILARVGAAGLKESMDAATATHAPHKLTMHSGNGRLRRHHRGSGQPRRDRVEADVPRHEAAHTDAQPLRPRATSLTYRPARSHRGAILQWRCVRVPPSGKGVARREPRQRGRRRPILPRRRLCWSSSLVRAKLDVRQALKRHGIKKDAEYCPTHVAGEGSPQIRGKGR